MLKKTTRTRMNSPRVFHPDGGGGGDFNKTGVYFKKHFIQTTKYAKNVSNENHFLENQVVVARAALVEHCKPNDDRVYDVYKNPSVSR